MLGVNINQVTNFEDFISSFRATLKEVFYQRNDIDSFIQERGFPALVLRDIMAANPLSVAIPTEYGGRGGKVRECLGLLEAASYESLPLTLTFGINIALFLEPVSKYAQESVKAGIFERFLKKQNMGGLMITEPDYGSDALNMQTTNEKKGSNYHIKGIKHWQGLTGMADYWVMACRSKKENGELNRDLDLFICDEHDPKQQIEVLELYNNLGLYPIPYGKNKVDIVVPEEYKLVPESTGIKMIMDLLHRSRFQFAGMGMGFIKRMLDEAIKHCSTRYVGGRPLIALDQVQYQISKIQTAFTLNSGMCHRSAAYSGIENNLATDIVEANSIKAYVTDLMQESAQLLTQLSGGTGYKAEHVGGRGIMDSRPFQIFEGSNAMLYTQIGDAVLKQMKRKKLSNLAAYLAEYDLTKKVVSHFSELLNFTVDTNLPQRKTIELGKMISRVVCSQYVTDLGEKGFRADLIRDCLQMVKHDISTLLCSYNNHTGIRPIEDYEGDSHWLQFS